MYMAPNDGFSAAHWVDVVITLWNPYNVELRLDGMEFEFRNVMQWSWSAVVNGSTWESASSGKPVHIAYMFNPNNPTLHTSG